MSEIRAKQDPAVFSRADSRIVTFSSAYCTLGDHYGATNGLHSQKGYSLDVSRVAIKSVGYAAWRIGPCL
jgi:hypothetical protein